MVLPKEQIYLTIIAVITNVRFTHESMMDENSVIDLNDILSENLMPASLFFMENPVDKGVVSEFRTLDNDTSDAAIYDGTFSNAYSTMGFHRKMIKEYMCSNFLAEQILKDVAPEHFQSRLGYPAMKISNTTEASHKTSRALKTDSIQESMRYDQGSSGYKDWLSKTATMEDIYRHILMSPVASNASLISSTLLANSDDPPKISNRRQDKNDENEYEEGDVTGYAMQNPVNSNEGLSSQMNPMMESMQNYPNTVHHHFAGNKIEYPSELYNQNAYSIDDEQSNLLLYNQFVEQMKAAHEHHSNYPVRHVNPFASLKEKFKKIFSKHKTEHEHEHEGYDHSGYGAQSYDKGSKEMGLKDLFDIALTTLAFLSFGMFILQVLMCITMSKSDNNNLMMMPMEVEEVNPDAEEVRRKRRSLTSSTLIEMNDVSRKILLSIEAVLISHKDDGKCLRNVICENNKYSRDLNNNQKLWIPVWGLGLSWLSSRIIPEKSHRSILEGLKASAFGLGRADCNRLFPCDIGLQRELRKKRRKTREANNYIFEWNI